MPRQAEHDPRPGLPRALSLARQPAIVPIVLVILAAAVLGWLGDRALRSIIEQNALRTVSLVASARAATLRSRVGRQRERAHDFLDTARLRCSGAQAQPCVRELLDAFVRTEQAIGATLAWPALGPVVAGSTPPSLADVPAPGRFVRFERAPDDASYVIHASAAAGANIAIRFSAARHLHEVFLDRDGLGDSGETFLTDQEGYFVTPARYPCHAGVSHPIRATPMQRCLAGESTATVAPDYRDVVVIHGFRKIDDTGGCIMAHVDYAEAMAPARRLRGAVLGVAAALVLAATFWSLLYRHMFSGPLSRLTARVRAFKAGDLEGEVPLGGPVEVVSLGRAFASMAETIRGSQAKLLEAIDAREAFLSLASHELRTPLHTLKLRLQVMQQRVRGAQGASGDIPGSLDVASRQVDRMTRLIEEMLDITRIQRGRLALDRVEVDLREIVRRVLVDLAVDIEQSRSVVELRDGEPVVALLDPFRIEQVCVNLITNALKYGQKQPITICVERVGGVARLVVKDRGLGIAPEDHDRIFAPFERAVSACHFGGLGLGLAITHAIVEAHGGTIRVESEVRAGATFTVDLPCVPS